MINKDCNFWNDGCEFSGRREDRDCDGCLEYEKEKKIIITPQERRRLKIGLTERTKVRHRKEQKRRQYYLK